MADKFFRLVSFVVNICPEPLRKMFLKYANTDMGTIFTTLDDYLRFRKSDISGSKRLRKDQLNLLYPKSSEADICQWDVSLLASIISELFASRINGLEKFQLNEIREIRNSLQHLPNTSSLTDPDYNQFWKRLEIATLHIARQTDGPIYEKAILAKIDEIRNGALSNIGDILRVWYEERIREMASNIEQLNTKIDEMSPDIKETASIVRKVTTQTPGPTGKMVKRIKTVDIILSRLKANFDATMKAELRSSFDPPPEAANVRTLLREKKHHVVVSGRFSSRYLETALAAITEINYTPQRCVEISTSSDWRHIDPEDVDLVLCRDPFGKDHYEETKVMSMADVFDNMLSTSKENTDAERIDIVLVTDHQILAEVRKRHDHEILEDAVNVFDVTTENQPADLTLGPDISIGAKAAIYPVASYLRGMTSNFIQHYGDDKIPAEDAYIKSAREVFKKNKVVVLVGPKEYGKVFAVALASSYKPSQCLLLTKPDDTLLIDADVCLAIIDQFAGKYRYSEDQVLKWFDMFDHLQLVVEAGRLNVVITCEKEKLERCSQVFQHALLEHAANLPDNDYNTVKNEVVLEDWTPLHEACNKGLADNAECLLQAGADIDALGDEKNTPIHKASMSGNIELVRMLLEHDANPEQKNDDGKTPADVAASSEIKALLMDACIKKNANKENRRQHKKVRRNCYGETPLHTAAKKPNVEDLKKTLNDSADVNVRDYAYWTPLHEACERGFVENAVCLLQAEADIEALGDGNDTPLHKASSSGKIELVKMLLDHGANPEQRNSDCETPADFASSPDIHTLTDAYVNRNANADDYVPSEREISMTDTVHDGN